MKFFLLAFLLFITTSAAYGETYKWKDSNGMHFTDNAASIPPQYREKVLEEARENNPAQPPQTVTLLPHQIGSQGVTLENNNQVNTGETPVPENKFIPPQPVINPPNFVPIQHNVENTLAIALAPFAGFMFFWILICLSVFVVWIITLVDIAKSEFTDPNNKTIWFLLVLFLQVLGIILYHLVGKEQKKESPKGETVYRISPEESKDGEFTL